MALDTPDGEKYVEDGWFTRFMRARRNELASLSMGASGLFLLGAVLTYNPFDPSFNTATAASPTNALGLMGATAADLALQWLGWAGAALGVMLFAWGVILFVRGPRRRGPKIVTIRVIAGLMAVSGLATAAASLPVPATWQIAAGLGGVLGDIVHSEILAVLEFIRLPLAGEIAGLLGLGIALLGLFAGYGVTPADIADAADAARRLAVQTRREMQRISDRYIAGLDDEVVRLEPIEPAGAITDGRSYREPDHAPAPTRARTEREKPSLIDRLLTPPTESDRRERDRVREPAPEARHEMERPRAAPREAAYSDHFGDTDFELPPLDLLTPAPPRDTGIDEDSLAERGEVLESVLLDFGVKGQVVNARPGPVVTLYEFEPAPGVKSSRVISLADDIARSMSAVSARVAVVPGRNVIGIELPNKTRETVYLSSLLETKTYVDPKIALPLALGETIGGEPYVADLSRMPHLLIAGTTGSGKSVGINAMILSLMYRLPPERCRFLMIDPKMLELSVYDGVPHLLAPVVTDPRKAVSALKWTVREMEQRYRKMSSVGVRNINGYNRRVEEAAERGEPLERVVQTGFEADTGKPIYERQTLDSQPMPYLVVVIDEMADLMLVAGKDIEAAVQRLAQMARAAGIHLITATQRPSVDVITGTIKANFPTRISFQVTSRIDSRTILGEQGAEQLLGQGDLLHMAAGGRIRRLHGPFVSDEEVEDIARFLKSQGEPEYLVGVTDDADESSGDLLSSLSGGGAGGYMEEGIDDDLYDQAVMIVTRERRASTSYLQRQLRIGYNRAASLIDRLEAEGVVSAANHAGRRVILAPPPPPPSPDS